MFDEVYQKMTDTVNSGKNCRIDKTTRVGVTTSTIISAVESGYRCLVLVPTNRIGYQTGAEAQEIARSKYKIDVKIGVYGSNLNTCLKLEGLRRQLVERFGNKVMIDKMPEVPKSTCNECEYEFEVLPIDNVVYKSSSDSGKCAYATITSRLEEFDILFMTFAKFHGITCSDPNTIPINLDDVKQFDKIIIDEVSMFVQEKTDTLVFKTSTRKRYESEADKWKEKTEEYFVIDYIKRDISRLSKWSSSITCEELVKYLSKFMEVYEDLNIKKGEFVILENDTFNPGEHKMFMRDYFNYYNLLMRFVIDTNLDILPAVDLLRLLRSKDFFVKNISTKIKPINITFFGSSTIKDKINYLTEYSEQKDRSLIVTDATMPSIDLTDIFKIRFHKTDIGDPHNSCLKQLIIGDTRNVPAYDILFGQHSEILQNNLIDFINLVIGIHGKKDLMIASQNSILNGFVKFAIRKGLIPKGVYTTYYRADDTIGVSQKRRVCIAIGSSVPPKGSQCLQAHTYIHNLQVFGKSGYKFVDMDIIEENMERTEGAGKYFQTISRVKDPLGERQSIVYNWGINQLLTNQLTNFNVPIPEVFIPKYRSKEKPYVHLIGRWWMDKGELPNELMIRIISYVLRQMSISKPPDFIGRKEILEKNKKYIYLRDIKKENTMEFIEMARYFGLDMSIESGYRNFDFRELG